MEIQWPLILFTTFLAWSGGLFSAQAGAALLRKLPRTQLPALVTSVVLMGIGGIAVFMHLQHWERMFNGFGHLTSGITQELIAVVVMALLMVVFFSFLRRRGSDAIPRWVCVLSALSGLVLIVVAGHSYMMDARPAWDNELQILSLVGAWCGLGPASLAVIAEIRGETMVRLRWVVLAGVLLNAVFAVGYLFFLDYSEVGLSSLGYYYDPTEIVRGMIDTDEASSIWYGTRAIRSAAVIVASVVALIAAAAKAFKQKLSWRIIGGIIVVCVLVSTICLRVVFCEVAQAVFMFFG